MRGNLFKLGLLVALVPVACGMNSQCDTITLPGGGTPGCTPVGEASIIMTITDEQGRAVPFAIIDFTFDGGGQVFSAFCDNQVACVDFPLALNAFGQFDLTVSAPGFLPENRTVIVGSQDDCNPTTENIVVVMRPDETVASLEGAWRTNNLFGESIIRFGPNGEIIGAILFDRTIAGDGNFYISYNNRPIRGVPGQDIFFTVANEPVRNGNIFHFVTDTLGIPVGFENATMTVDFASLSGTLAGTGVQYDRLQGIPEALQDP